MVRQSVDLPSLEILFWGGLGYLSILAYRHFYCSVKDEAHDLSKDSGLHEKRLYNED